MHPQPVSDKDDLMLYLFNNWVRESKPNAAAIGVVQKFMSVSRECLAGNAVVGLDNTVPGSALRMQNGSVVPFTTNEKPDTRPAYMPLTTGQGKSGSLIPTFSAELTGDQ